VTKKVVFDRKVLNSSLLPENPSLKLLRIIGSPFALNKEASSNSEESLELYNLAVKNKISMLYLEALKQQRRLHRLEAKYEEERAKYLTFINEVAKVSRVLEAAGIRFAVYKTIKPYPALPNDIDIIILGDNSVYEKAAEVLLRAHYEVALPGVVKTESLTNDDAYKRAARLATKPTSYKHEHISPAATNFIETEHNTSIDLHREIAMNYTVYMDKKNFEGHVVRTSLNNGEEIKTLAPDLDLACTVVHSLMEHLYLLGGYYTFLFQLLKMDESGIGEFVNIIKENKITLAAKAFTTVTAGLCRAAYGVIPEKVYTISDKLDLDTSELENITNNDFNTPHRYKIQTIARVLMEKNKEARFRRSVLKQLMSMMNPMQAKLIISELVNMRRRKAY